MSSNTTAILSVMAIFFSVGMLAYAILGFLSQGWKSYEEKYVAGAARTLDAMYLTITPQQMFYISIFSTLAVGLLVGAVTTNLSLAIPAGCLAFAGPTIVVKILKSRRDKKFGVQLVDALIAMGNGLRAGYSLPAAFELIAREMENPMGQEMRLVTQEMRLGVSMDDALRHLHTRMPSEDLDILITSIGISREVGGNLSEVFDNIADTIRDRHRIEGKISSLTAQGKLQALILGMLPIVIGIALNAVNPTMMKVMYETWAGLGLLGLIVVLEVLGVFMIWRIVSIKV